MNKDFENRVCMNGSNEECKNVSNGCFSDLEEINSFYYPDDKMNSEEGSELAVKRIRLGWKAFNNIFYLCSKRHTWNMKEQIYCTCVRPVGTYGSETWVVRSVEENSLRKAINRNLRMMCGVQLADSVSAKELMISLKMDNKFFEVMRQKSLRWLDHVVKKMMIVLSRRGDLKWKVISKKKAKVSLKIMIENLC